MHGQGSKISLEVYARLHYRSKVTTPTLGTTVRIRLAAKN